MNYLLTEEEYEKLKDDAGLIEDETNQKLMKLCTMVADHMPVKEFGNKPWGCIHTVEVEHYCDHCPVIDYCPSIKNCSR